MKFGVSNKLPGQTVTADVRSTHLVVLSEDCQGKESFKILDSWSGEIAQRLRAPVALTENQSWIPSTHLSQSLPKVPASKLH